MGKPAEDTSRHFCKYIFSTLGCQLCCSILSVEPRSKMLGVDLLADQQGLIIFLPNSFSHVTWAWLGTWISCKDKFEQCQEFEDQVVCKASPQALRSYFLTSFIPASTELRLGCSQQTESSKPMLFPTTTNPLEETAAELEGNMSTFLLGNRFRQALTKTASETCLCQRKLQKIPFFHLSNIQIGLS